MSHDLEVSIEANEGFSNYPYKDTRGLWTFGIGQCVERDPLSADEWKYLLDNQSIVLRIEHEGARWLMQRRAQQRASELAARLPWFTQMDPVAQDVLVEMSYQMGVNGVLGFRNMLTALSAHNYKTAAFHGRDSDWWRIQTRARAERLMKKLESVSSTTKTGAPV